MSNTIWTEHQGTYCTELSELSANGWPHPVTGVMGLQQFMSLKPIRDREHEVTSWVGNLADSTMVEVFND
jgi:hypothetical protein